MSGTSADGIDAALVDFSEPLPRLVSTFSYPLPNNFREAVLKLSQSPSPVSPQTLAQLDVRAGYLFSEAANMLLKRAVFDAAEITAIGSHGQTLYHDPASTWPYTVQIGDPNVIAQQTGITTVADFRRRDIAVGGQGAPLAPAFHNALFRHASENRAVLNIGGIANITLLPADSNAEVIGFDTGPGNGLMDAWIQRHLDQKMDVDGTWAASGQVNQNLLYALLSDPYFQQAAPKSTGRDYFNLTWLEQHGIKQTSPPDIQATLLALTVASVKQALDNMPQTIHRLMVCGGGASNSGLMHALAKTVQPIMVESTEAYGCPPDWVEAVCFAWLAKRRLENLPSNLPSVTGAKQAVVLGGVY